MPEALNLPDNLELYARLALALGIGLIIGIERGWRSRDQPDGSRTAGIRTFTLFGFLGGVAGSISGDAFVIAGFVGVLALLTAAYVTGQAEKDAARSVTSEAAALITYGLGVLAIRGDMVLAAAAAVTLMAILASREIIHGWIKQVEQAQLKAAIQVLVVSVVILPVLPNEGFGPGQVLNPFELWWMVVVITGISFVALAAVKWLGPRAGIFWTGLLGGLASSTAVAIGYARLAKDTPSLANVLAVGVGAATTVKFLRSLAVALIIFPAAAQALVPSLLGGGVLAGVATWLVARRAKRKSHETETADVGKSADLTVALSFAAVLAGTTVAAHYAKIWFGAVGIIAVAAVTGLVDVDAVTVSTARQAVAAGSAEALQTMALAVAVAVAVNTLAKLGYIYAIAGSAMAKSYGVIALAAIAGLTLGAMASVL